jgi:hypothetical protein
MANLKQPTETVPARLDREEIPDHVPCLIAPDGTYDLELNNYFLLNPVPENTQAAIAYDLAGFLTFLWCHRQPLTPLVARRHPGRPCCLPALAPQRRAWPPGRSTKDRHLQKPRIPCITRVH